MPADVFVSHSIRDNNLASNLVYALEESGISCWMSRRDLSRSLDWERSMQDALEVAKIVLVILSPEFIDFEQVRNELESAYNTGKRFIVVQEKRIEPPKSISYYLRGAKTIVIDTQELEIAIRGTVTAIQIALVDIDISAAKD